MTQTAERVAAPALVALAPDPLGSPGRERVDRMLDALRMALPDVEVQAPYLTTPQTRGPVDRAFDAVMEQLRRPSVLLPLSLSGRRRMVPAIARTEYVHVAEPLGPDRLLARALSVRLRQAGAQWGDAVVLAAGDLPDQEALADAQREADMLASEWGSPVSLACTSSLGPSVHEAVRELQAAVSSRVFVASYLLTPGPVARAIADSAHAAGAIGVGEVLAGHRLLVELMVQRYRAALSTWPVASAGASTEVATD